MTVVFWRVDPFNRIILVCAEMCSRVLGLNDHVKDGWMLMWNTEIYFGRWGESLQHQHSMVSLKLVRLEMAFLLVALASRI